MVAWFCNEWSWKGLFLMAGFGGALLDPFDCFVLPVCNGVLKVTFLFSRDGIYCCWCCSFICYFNFNDA